MNVLVTGGNGYIGSHTVVELVKQGHDVVIVDNFVNSKRENLDVIDKLCGKHIPSYEINICNGIAVVKILLNSEYGICNCKPFAYRGRRI